MTSMNYGYSPSSGFSSSTYSSSFSSTPSGLRSQRNRFAYSGPSPYPRPRSSASKPNPDSLSDSMINNYGNSSSLLDSTFPAENESSYNSFRSPNSSSNYFSGNDSFYPPPSEEPVFRGNSEPVGGYLRDSSQRFSPPKYPYDNNSYGMQNSNSYGMQNSNPSYGMQNSNPSFGMQNSNTSFGMSTSNASFGIQNSKSSFGMQEGGGEFKGRFNKKNQQDFKLKGTSNGFNSKPFYQRKFGKPRRNMSDKKDWKCNLCSINFTSQIPLDMHLRGAKHAKKVKAEASLQSIQSQVKSEEIETQGKTFFCEICNVKANSSFQLQTHLDGTKHKNKKQSKEGTKAGTSEGPKTGSEVNGKSNGATIRQLPSEFGEPQPAKLAKFSCDVCNIVVNSDVQLQQHLTSKKHQAKVEGKPLIKGKKNKRKQAEGAEAEQETDNGGELMDVGNRENEASKTVKGVKTLQATFVQGETLQ